MGSPLMQGGGGVLTVSLAVRAHVLTEVASQQVILCPQMHFSTILCRDALSGAPSSLKGDFLE